jgi:hypothetical protein
LSLDSRRAGANQVDAIRAVAGAAARTVAQAEAQARGHRDDQATAAADAALGFLMDRDELDRGQMA